MIKENEMTVVSLPKLGDFNYNSWKRDLKVLLMEKGFWEFIIGTAKPCPDDVSDRDKHVYELRKQRAYTTIYMGVERKYQTLISDTEDGKIAWETLKENFEPISRARLASLIDGFFSSRFDPTQETIGMYCKKTMERNRKIQEAGFRMPDILVCFQLIRFLPPEYDNLVQILYRLKDAEFTIAEVTKQLITESGRIELKMKDENDYQSSANAYASRVKKSENNQQKCKNTETMQRSYSSGNMMDPGIRRKVGS
ncbi:uncharacterized protein LOC129980766 [Argiope bruennichi]|uniref:uncharacterized protein LOC129980766 n=1 Tax=Argiope bruennichi TaxID=94029 RepID=UPI002494F529|nr:uncharacterized protein LOC129980766 [Argiope bruennichi]